MPMDNSITVSLKKGTISATLGESTIDVKTQGAVLSPLLWTMLFEDLLRKLLSVGALYNW